MTTTFSGPIRSRAGSFTTGPLAVPVLGAAVTVDPVTFAGRTIRVTLASGTITLPAIDATTGTLSTIPSATNNLGAMYTFYIDTASTALVIATTGSDKYVGVLSTLNGVVGGGYLPNGSSNNTITLNGTTTGGIVGTEITVQAIAAGKWQVSGLSVCSGTTATPFSG